MEVDELSEDLNVGDHSGDDIATAEHLPINLDGRLPSGAGDRGGRKSAAAWES
jgi:hypothetical protein